jgi:hypothetical protein
VPRGERRADVEAAAVQEVFDLRAALRREGYRNEYDEQERDRFLAWARSVGLHYSHPEVIARVHEMGAEQLDRWRRQYLWNATQADGRVARDNATPRGNEDAPWAGPGDSSDSEDGEPVEQEPAEQELEDEGERERDADD